MPQRETLRVTGLEALLRAAEAAGPDTERQIRTALRKSGDVLKRDWSVAEQRFGWVTATGLKTVVRFRGVSVEQTRGKSPSLSRRRRNFGPKQLAIGRATLAKDAAQVQRAAEDAVNKLVDHFINAK